MLLGAKYHTPRRKWCVELKEDGEVGAKFEFKFLRRKPKRLAERQLYKHVLETGVVCSMGMVKLTLYLCLYSKFIETALIIRYIFL